MSLRRRVERLLALIRKRRLDSELDGEVQAHLELAERDAIAAGMSPEEARQAARRAFGGIEQVKERHRDDRTFRWMATLLRDFRFGLASLVRNPGFALIAIGVLALGIGANTAMFSLVDAVLLKPIPFPEPDRIVRVWETPRPGATNSTSTLDFVDWKRLNDVFEALSAEQSISAALVGEGEPVRLTGKLVTAEYFKVFGTRALLGRTFIPEDDQPGAAPMVVLSHALWQGIFGGDTGILQRRPVLDGEAHQVIGVLPPGAFDRDEAGFWKPLIFTPDQHTRDFHWLTVFGRLREAVTIQQANADMDRIDHVLAEVTPAFKLDWTIVVEPFERLLVGDNLRQSIILAFGAVILVLLIASANVANLLLARGATRQKEMAVRAALGAGRGRLVAQLLTESLALCLVGGAAGVALAYLLILVANPILPELIPYTADVSLDLRVLAFAATIALGVALLAGVLPSVQTSFGKLSQSMKQSGRGSSGGQARLRRLIVVGEVALSLVLVSGAILLFTSLLNLQQIETGIRIDNIIAASVNLPAPDYQAPGKTTLFYDAVVERLEASPGVEQAALTNYLPLLWIGNGEGLFVPGIDEPINVRFKRVDPGYFDTLGISLTAGRGLARRDRSGAPNVAVVNETLARRLAEVAGMQDPIGRRVQLTSSAFLKKDSPFTNVEIVGSIHDELVSRAGSTDPPVVYVPLAQAPDSSVKLIIRTQTDPASAVPTIREAMRQVDPNLPLGDIATMQQVQQRTLAGNSRPAWLIGIFAAVAALLAALGLYGVLAYAVVQQRRELGVRMALGARPGDVLSYVLGSALRMITIGIGLGLAGTFALTRGIESLLFQVSPRDPAALMAACTSMLVIGLLAGLIPARRAARINPITVLREEG